MQMYYSNGALHAIKKTMAVKYLLTYGDQTTNRFDSQTSIKKILDKPVILLYDVSHCLDGFHVCIGFFATDMVQRFWRRYLSV